MDQMSEDEVDQESRGVRALAETVAILTAHSRVATRALAGAHVAIRKARQLHPSRDGQYCDNCLGHPYPCRTRRDLDHPGPVEVDVAGLGALPERSVVLLHDEVALQRRINGWYGVFDKDPLPLATLEVLAPFRVIWIGQPGEGL